MFEVFPKKEPAVFLGLSKTEWKELGVVELVGLCAFAFVILPVCCLTAMVTVWVLSLNIF